MLFQAIQKTFFSFITFVLQLYYKNITFLFPLAPSPLTPFFPSLNSFTKSSIVIYLFLSAIATLLATIKGSRKSIKILAGDDAVIADIMVEEPVFAHTDDDKEDVIKALAKYDFLAMPIVDSEGRLVGIVTIDDAMDVLQEEDTEDMEIMAGMSPSDKPYLKMGVFELWWARIPWLMLLMVSATFSSKILTSFEAALSAVPVLVAFVPQLTGTSGNAGSQASVAVIRGLSLGEIELRDIFRVLWKEIRVSILCGISLGIVNFIKMFLLNDVSRDKYGLEMALLISFVVCLTMVLSVILAKIVGCTLPILAKRLGLDPAVVANPFITTIIDVVALLTYFGIARALLGLA